MHYLRAFGVFWYDFLVGDRPELFVGSIAILAAVWLVIRAGLGAGAAGPVLTVLLLALGLFSVWTATRRRR